MSISVCAVVEGHGEVESVGHLLRRVGEAVRPDIYLDIKTPIRIPRSKLVKADELEKAVELGKRKIGGRGLIFVLLDADDDCPFDLGPKLLARAELQLRDIHVSVVLPKSEYETWFIAAATSLAGRRGISDHIVVPPNIEDIRDAKGWLSRHMPHGKNYSETLDQPAFTSIFDINMARQSPSFDKFYRDVERLLRLTAENP